MVVKVRFPKGPLVQPGRTKNQRLALGFASLLVPGILAAWVLVAWRFASDLGFAETFAIEEGPFAHWQPWTGVAVILHLAVAALNRYANKPVVVPETRSEAARISA